MVLSAKKIPDAWAGFLLISFPQQTPSPPSTPLTSKALSTLSICALLLFTTLLIFTLSPFDSPSSLHIHRRLLQFPSTALQGMGLLYRRGTRAMPDLIVAHVPHTTDEISFRSFLRLLHNNGLLARSDLVFLFPCSSISARFSPVIQEENNSLMKLLRGNPIRKYLRKKDGKKESKDSIWGKGVRFDSNLIQSNRTSYGSIVGFDATELDPENGLGGFLENPAFGLRRWACYPMLLGRVRRSYKHVMLADVESVLVLNDPFSRVRSRAPESVVLWTRQRVEPESKRGKKQVREPVVIPGFFVGGCKGIRRFSDAVLTEIVRAAVDDHKGRNAGTVTDSGIVNRVVRSGHLLRSANVVMQYEAIADAGSGSVYNSNAVVVYRGNVSMGELLL